MSTLSDRDILLALADASIGVWPCDESLIQPSSIDLLLSSEFLVPLTEIVESDVKPGAPRQSGGIPAARVPMVKPVDTVTRAAKWRREDHNDHRHAYRLAPGAFALGSTVERVYVGPKYRGKIDGKSSLGRLGLLVHVTAGYLDPGFSGRITLEFYNAAPWPLDLIVGAPICQVSFDELTSVPDRPYGSPGLGSRYQGQEGTTGARR